MEKQNNKKIWLIGGILVLLIGVIGITFAYFSTGGAQEQANTFSSGCLNIELTNESASISLDNVYPITDIEGLEGTSYDFTIKNNCSTSTNYQINLESLNQASNSLSADYIKVSLSSDTVGNVISILGDNTSVTPELEGAHELYNLYTASIGANEEKTYHLKIWLDYDATVEVAASKVYQSKINVIANPDTQVIDTLEAKFSLEGSTLTSTLTDNVTSATYCTTTDDICTPNTTASIQNNSYTIELQGNENKQMVCTRLNGTSKIICSNPLEVKPKYLREEILANATTQSTRTDFTTTVTEDTTGTIYYADTSKGRTYYFAGNPTDNWVKFADKYWRIIRINEDGTIRLIYQGDVSSGPVEEGESTQIQTSAFNSSYRDNMYVGYMYQSNQVHGLTSSSTIKEVLDQWYQNNLTSVADKIDGNAGFCGDRQPSTSDTTSNGSGGTGTTKTYYGAYVRLYGNNKAPTFECQNSSDLYTISGSSQGNKALTYPIGLITADEVAYAGGVYGTANQSYYLYTNSVYWTMSPSDFSVSRASVFRVYLNGGLNENYVNNTDGVRPVINLKANVQITRGNGSSSNPYVIS